MSDEYNDSRWGGHSLGRFTGDEDAVPKAREGLTTSWPDDAYFPRIVKLHERGDALGVLMPNGHTYGVKFLDEAHLRVFKDWLNDAFSKTRSPSERVQISDYSFVPPKYEVPPQISKQDAAAWFSRIDDDCDIAHRCL